MADTLIDRAASVAELVKRSSSFGMVAEVRGDGSVWLHGPGESSVSKIGSTVANAAEYLNGIEMGRHYAP